MFGRFEGGDVVRVLFKPMVTRLINYLPLIRQRLINFQISAVRAAHVGAIQRVPLFFSIFD